MMDLDSLFQRGDSVATTTVVTVPPPPNPALLDEGGRYHLRATFLLLLVPEGRVSSLNLGALLFMADENYCRQRLNRLRDVLECLCIEQDTEL